MKKRSPLDDLPAIIPEFCRAGPAQWQADLHCRGEADGEPFESLPVVDEGRGSISGDATGEGAEVTSVSAVVAAADVLAAVSVAAKI